jgi:hypothetical protein
MNKFLFFFNTLLNNLIYILKRIYITLYKHKKFIIIIILFLFFKFFLFFFTSPYFFILLYKFLFLYLIDPFLLYFIEIYYITLEYLLNFKILIIKKFYSLGNFFYIKKNFSNNIFFNNEYNNLKIKNKSYFKRYIFLPFFNIFENTSFYKKFNNNIIIFENFYKKRLGSSNIKIREIGINSYGKTPRYKKYIKIARNHYTYLYIINNKPNSLANYNFSNLFIRNSVLMIINHSGLLSKTELLNYRHNIFCYKFQKFQLIQIHSKYLMKIGMFNYRAHFKQKIYSFENTGYKETLFNLKKTKQTLNLLKKSINLTYRQDFQKSNFYLFRTFDSYYKIGTTKMYFRRKANKAMIEFLSLNTNFYFYIYYTFIKIPIKIFFFKNFYFSYNKEINILIPLKIFFFELIKKENLYIIIFFFYSCYLSYKFYLYKEIHSLYGLLYFKRHLLSLLFLAFIFKFNLEAYNILTTELYFILFLPSFYNIYVFENYWWWSWEPEEKVKYQYSFNHDFSLLHPFYILLLYILSPSNIIQLFIFKIIIFILFLNYFRKIDFRWKTILKKNIFFIFYNFIFYIFYTKFFYLNEINLRKKKLFFFNKINSFYVKYKLNFNINKFLYIQFDLYSRVFLKNLNLKNKLSNILFFKFYFQLIFYYLLCFILFFGIFFMCIKIFFNIFFIFIFFFINNNFEFLWFLNKFESFFYFIKNNLYLTLFKEYIIEQNINFKNYQLIGRYRITQAFHNKNKFKFNYPFLYSYRLTKNFNNYYYWFLAQKGNNKIGESYYTNTIINDLLKKNSLYFYKYEIYDLDLKKYKHKMLKSQSYYFVNKRKILRKNYLIHNLYETQFKFNLINISDYFFIFLFNKNSFLLKSPYVSINNLVTYQRYGNLFPRDFLTPKFIWSKEKLNKTYIKTNGNFYIRQLNSWYQNYSNKIFINNYLFIYTKFFKKGGLSLITWLQLQKENEINNLNFFYKYIRILNKNIYNKLDILYKNEIYDIFIPTRVDYIKFHNMLTNQMYFTIFDNYEKNQLFYEKLKLIENKKLNIIINNKINFLNFFKSKKNFNSNQSNFFNNIKKEEIKIKNKMFLKPDFKTFE